MKKAALLTLNGNYNFGNKLQHYGLQKYLEKLGVEAETIRILNKKEKNNLFKDMVKLILRKKSYLKFLKFKEFDKLIKYSNSYVLNNKIYNYIKYKYYIVGSDQVWNVKFQSFSKEYLLQSVESKNKISYASSFGLSALPNNYKSLFKENLFNFRAISVREDTGKKIIEELTNRKDVEVLIDPTMLLTDKEWDLIAKEPIQIKKIKEKKYILNYFLGELSKKRKEEIKRIAKKNNCEIINVLDLNSPFYQMGPSEFLWLEKNAFLICTDSFHSCVFAILYNKPFVIFEREQKDMQSMNTRLETLISKFKLENRKYEGKITEDNLKHDYSEAYKVLVEERKKSKNFLKKALEIKESD